MVVRHSQPDAADDCFFGSEVYDVSERLCRSGSVAKEELQERLVSLGRDRNKKKK